MSNTPLSARFSRTVRERAKKVLRKTFEAGQPLGLDILPRHFYSEIPDIRELRKTAAWRKPFSMTGIPADIACQLACVDSVTRAYRGQLKTLDVLKTARETNATDQGFGPVDAEFLYCVIRYFQPPTIVQIGCGVSTAICLRAAEHQDYRPAIICIEPYPTRYLEKSAAAGEIRLIPKKLQDVYVECAGLVSGNDLLFVDSTHTLGPAGEVSRIILEILPRLQENVLVHFHDIWFPYDYGPDILGGALCFQHETALLYAFLCMNARYRIQASLSLLHHHATEELRRCLPTYVPASFVDGLYNGGSGVYPSSIYLRS